MYPSNIGGKVHTLEFWWMNVPIIHPTPMVQTLELQCICHRHPMVANVGIFKVADAPTNRNVYSIPLKDTWVMERFWKYDKFYFFVPVAQAPVRGAHPIIEKVNVTNSCEWIFLIAIWRLPMLDGQFTIVDYSNRPFLHDRLWAIVD